MSERFRNVAQLTKDTPSWVVNKSPSARAECTERNRACVTLSTRFRQLSKTA